MIIKNFIYTNSTKPGFTLAEVLITLGIIGAVAALTMPVLVGNYQKKQTVTKLKRAFSVLSQAVLMSELDNGSTEFWNYNLEAKEFYDIYLKKYLITTEDVQFSEIRKVVTYRYLNNVEAEGAIGNNNSYAIKLNDGTFVIIDGWFDAIEGNSRNIIFDINGLAKPNKIGRDVFYFRLYKKKGLIGYDESGDQGCERNASGYSCSQKIMEDGWEIKDDYPW